MHSTEDGSTQIRKKNSKMCGSQLALTHHARSWHGLQLVNSCLNCWPTLFNNSAALLNLLLHDLGGSNGLYICRCRNGLDNLSTHVRRCRKRLHNLSTHERRCRNGLYNLPTHKRRCRNGLQNLCTSRVCGVRGRCN